MALGFRSFLAAIAMSAFAGAALGQTPPAPTAPPDKVTVVGQQTEEAIRNFVGQIAEPSSKGQNQLARWDRSICPGLLGLKPQVAQGFVDRIAYRAVNIDLQIGAPGCKSNVLVIVSPKPDDVARELYDKFGSRMGRYSERGLETQGRNKLKTFVSSDKPVRWWHVAKTVTEDGESLHTDSMNADASPPVTLRSAASMIKRPTRQDFASIFVIVDANRMAGVDFNALGDYLAMISLAQVDSDMDATNLPSILNLFAKRDASQPALTGMTEWDIAYLHGLYGAQRESGSAQRQESEIASDIRKTMKKNAAKDEAAQ